ncbi:MAG: hypothetical protein U0414_37795 [Polyangiaceae bacterium]
MEAIDGGVARLWLLDLVDRPSEGEPSGAIVGLRMELRGDHTSASAWVSSDGALPTRLLLDPRATWVNLRAFIRTPEGECLSAGRGVAVMPNKDVPGRDRVAGRAATP